MCDYVACLSPSVENHLVEASKLTRNEDLNDESDQWTRLSVANPLQVFVVTNPEVVDAVEARVAVESNSTSRSR